MREFWTYVFIILQVSWFASPAVAKNLSAEDFSGAPSLLEAALSPNGTKLALYTGGRDGDISLRTFVITPTGLKPLGRMSLNEAKYARSNKKPMTRMRPL